MKEEILLMWIFLLGALFGSYAPTSFGIILIVGIILTFIFSLEKILGEKKEADGE